MSSVWIVHRDPRLRAAIGRLAAAAEQAILGAPGDPLFDAAPQADVILLGLAGDFEAELQFAHRVTSRRPAAAWILLPERKDIERARRLFDTVDAEILGYPPDAHAVRELIRAAPERRAIAPLRLSQRPARDALSERFARWFGDLELPELLRALDPRLTDVPLLIRGEPGTGRGVLARYVQAFGGTAAGALAQVACTATTSVDEIRAGIAAASQTTRARASLTIWLEDVDRLPAAVQHRVESWIEFAPPEGVLLTPTVRWIGTAGEGPGPEPGLRQALGGLTIRIQPLRERPHRVAPFANQTALAWCSARGEPPRRFGEDAVAVLEEYPWPGNLRELEAVVGQTLSASSADPLPADDLQYDGGPFAPIYAGEVGSLIADEDLVAPGAEAEGPAPAPAAEPIPEVEAEAEHPAEAAPEELPPVADTALRRLAGAIAHEVRNPLTTIRTFAELLPERYRDTEFRTRFAELVSHDVQRIEDVVERLNRLASLTPPRPETVDVAALLEELLQAHRQAIHSRRLLVLRELDTDRPFARGDPDQLHFALEALLHKSLELVPDRGDVYFASRHHPSGPGGRPSMRVLVRFRGRAPDTAPAPGARVSPSENAVEFAVAEAIVRAQGGTLAIDTTDGNETVIVLDLPAPEC